MNAPTSGDQSKVASPLRLAALAATLLLIALLARWVIVAPTTPRIIVGAILALPFALGAPFLYIGHRRTYAWLTLALAPSLVMGLMEAVADPPTRAWSALFVFVLLATFALCVAYLRVTRSSSLP